MFVKSSILLCFYFSYNTFTTLKSLHNDIIQREEKKKDDRLKNIMWLKNDLNEMLSLNDKKLESTIEYLKIRIEIFNKEMEISDLIIQKLRIQEHTSHLPYIIASCERTKNHAEHTLLLYCDPNSLNLDLFFDEEKKTQYRKLGSSLSMGLDNLLKNISKLSSDFQKAKEILIDESKKDYILSANHELESLKIKLKDFKSQVDLKKFMKE